MTSATHVHEIVHFAFRAEVSEPEQHALIASASAFLRTRRGFVSRHAYYSAETGRWIDHVVWEDLPSAKGASDQASKEPALGPFMTAIDHATMSFGHYEEVLR